MSLFKVLLLCVSSAYTVAYLTTCVPRKVSTKLQLSSNFNEEHNEENNNNSNIKKMTMATNRKQFLATTSSLIIPFLVPNISNAGIDPSALRTLSVEGDDSGAAGRLRSIAAPEEKAKEDDMVQMPFEQLPSGVSYREYRAGTGDAVVQKGSKVGTEMTIRCRSFATAKEPGGLKYYTTNADTDFNELAFTVGSGSMLPGLEEGMMGMRKNAIRRVEVPSTMVFPGRDLNQLPMPSAKNKEGNRLYERLFKTDATLMFEVKVTRIK